ncbi:MAG TPA: dUTP diphosphatase [Bdellovibrionota bacterium]|jgi:dUTP pyrophosphatase|nr:dUTP diphosphatase [Bdellovibrionota bacterium]
MQTLKLQWKKLSPSAQIPALQTGGAACFDLVACLAEPLTLAAGDVHLIPTGLAVAIPEGYEMQVRARSGLAAKHGFTLVNGIGTIDSDYRGEIKVISTLLKTGATLTIQPGDRIAQACLAPTYKVEHLEVESLDETARGAGGFGSTGGSATLAQGGN